ncbi:hypothetical protein Tco_0694055 [Tanacetum coccineum]
MSMSTSYIKLGDHLMRFSTSVSVKDFTYQVENKNTKKVNVMYYPRFTKLNVNFFMSKDPSIPWRNKINWHYARDDPMFTTINDIRNSESYKEYYDIASREVPPKTKASVHKKKANSKITPKEKPSTDPKNKRVKQTGKMTGSRKQKQRLETLSKIALTKTKQLKIANNRSQNQTHSSQASGSVDGVNILSKVPNEEVYEKTGTDEGTFSDGDDDEDDDANKDSDAHDDDDDATELDDDGDNITHPKLSTFSTDDQEEHNDEEEQEDEEEDEEEISDQLVHTPSDYQTTDESEKQTDDDKVKDGEEDKEQDMTNVNLEGGDVDMTEDNTTKDTEDAYVTLTAATPIVQQQSSSVSDLVSKFIYPTTDEGIDSILTPHTESPTLVNVPISVATATPATTTTIPPPLFPFTQSSQQTPVTTTTTTNPSTTPLPLPNFASVFGFNQRVTALESDLSKLKQSNPFAEAISSIPGIVNEYLGSKMKEAVDVAIQLKSNKFREEAQAKNQEFLNSLNSNMQKLIKDQVKTQTSKIKYKVKKYVTESLGAEVLIRSTNQPQTSYRIASSLLKLELKRILMDKIEENKSIGRSDVQKNLYNALVKAYNTDKDLISSYGTKGWRSSKEAESSKEPTRKENRTTSSSKGASRSQPTDLNETTHLEFITGDDDVIPAKEITDLAQAAGKQSSFDEFMATPIDFSAFMINRLKIDHLTQELLTSPTYDLIKGTCKSIAELDYHLEEVFKATNEQLDWNNPEGMPYPHNLSKPLPLIPNAQGRLVIPFDHFINNDLEYLKGGSSSRKYTTSITKIKAADYGQVKWIEDGIPRTTRSVVPIDYDKHAYWGTYHWDELSRNRLMRTDELHKFSDDTLNHVCTTLNNNATGIQMDYLPKRRWSPQDKRIAQVMISDIDRKLRDRRLMRSLEKFIGGRPYGGDLRLLERTI